VTTPSVALAARRGTGTAPPGRWYRDPADRRGRRETHPAGRVQEPSEPHP
jgi:hypothetical protein